MSGTTDDRGRTGVVEAPAGDQPELKRVMGPKLLLLFIVGDILGTGVYALTGSVAGEVGGAAWAPFLAAFAVATITAFSYLELVTKYPQAAGAALYTHKAFGIHFFTFIVCFAVMCSGITSASTASNAFAGFLRDGFGLKEQWPAGSTPLLLIALGFMALVAAINFRGVGESVKANVVLTLVELSGLLLVIFIGLYAVTEGKADFSRTVVFESPSDKSAFFAVTAATSLAFFAMVGFEDSVNMAEETKDPEKTFPRIMLTGLGITGLIYVLVSITAVALVPVGTLSNPDEGSALTQVVAAGAPDFPFDKVFPFIGMFAVANSALINMLMASRLLYGMAKQEVLPPFLGKVHPGRRTPWAAILFTTAIAFGLIIYVVRANASEEGASTVALLGGTTALLLLCVFTVVNIAVLVLRRDSVSHSHFRAPSVLPYLGAALCAFLAGPWARSEEQQEQYKIAGGLLAVGVVLWALTWVVNRFFFAKKTYMRDPEELDDPDHLHHT
ncbi:APC family permease [Knoellia flava]|uniref:Amino acid permease n=1 Tax=Knoellia flava TaxID=913969 RepID=A0A8H9KSL4_9MICO|nr:APC family permease [Knoellia flava]GGB90724.1 amino acid permease [Knoellia flava]